MTGYPKNPTTSITARFTDREAAEYNRRTRVTDPTYVATGETWEIEVGNEATVTEQFNYHGTSLGAIRAAKRRWRTRGAAETSVVLRRPGCRPFRFYSED